jgi:hypothetical protein
MKKTVLKALLWIGGGAALLSAVGLLVVAPVLLARYGERPAPPAASKAPAGQEDPEVTPSVQ